MKRLFDLTVSVILLVLFCLIMLLVGLLILLETKGCAIYKQKRIGLNGEVFNIYKFRSMVDRAENVGSFYTKTDDPRITKVGKFIRRTSLDELPQLVNVLKGDMSLVGPRPDVPEQRNIYTKEEWMLRHSVRPGITGLQQATLRSAATIEQRKILDFEYVNKRGFCLDFYILWKTILQIIFKGGN